MDVLHRRSKFTRKMNDFNINVTRVMNTLIEEMPYVLNLDGLQLLHVEVMLYFFSIYFAVYFINCFIHILLTVKQFIFSHNRVLMFTRINYYKDNILNILCARPILRSISICLSF